jgi:ribose transport system permease protein
MSGGFMSTQKVRNANSIQIEDRVVKVKEFLERFGILFFLLIAIVIFFAFLNPRFVSSANIVSVVRQCTYLGIMALGQMCVLLVGGFDLSVGAVAGLVSIVTTQVMLNCDSPVAAILLGIAAGLSVGIIVGVINGFVIAYFDISPFITTLAMMQIISGITLTITSGAPVYGFTDSFCQIFGVGNILGISSPIFIFAIIAIILYSAINYTTLGRHFWAIGGNVNAAKLSGISNMKYQIYAYVISGLLAAVTGILLSARVCSGEPTLGHSLMMVSLVACVIGGVAVGGGSGNVPGTIMGAVVIGVLANGMNLINLGSYGQEIVMGIFLLTAIVFDRSMNRWK